MYSSFKIFTVTVAGRVLYVNVCFRVSILNVFQKIAFYCHWCNRNSSIPIDHLKQNVFLELYSLLSQ